MKDDTTNLYSDEAINGFIDKIERNASPDGNNHSILKTIEDKFKLKEDAIKNIVKEDDWSFIIKSHAIIESSLNFSITERLGCSALEDVISFLDTSNSKNGKTEFAKNLLLLEKIDITYIRKLSEIRNKLVHNIYNLGYSLADDYRTMNKEQKSSFVNKALCYAVENLNNENLNITEMVTKNPESIKILMFMHILKIVMWLHMQGGFDKALSEYSLDKKLEKINNATNKI